MSEKEFLIMTCHIFFGLLWMKNANYHHPMYLIRITPINFIWANVLFAWHLTWWPIYAIFLGVPYAKPKI